MFLLAGGNYYFYYDADEFKEPAFFTGFCGPLTFNSLADFYYYYLELLFFYWLLLNELL